MDLAAVIGGEQGLSLARRGVGRCEVPGPGLLSEGQLGDELVELHAALAVDAGSWFDVLIEAGGVAGIHHENLPGRQRAAGRGSRIVPGSGIVPTSGSDGGAGGGGLGRLRGSAATHDEHEPGHGGGKNRSPHDVLLQWSPDKMWGGLGWRKSLACSGEPSESFRTQ